MSQKSNQKTALSIVAIAVAMLSLAYASVPLYDLFCRVTGFGGTPKTDAKYFLTDSEERQIINREVEVIFSADTNPNLPWEFKPQQSKMTVRVGEENLAFYEATNLSDRATEGTSTYNVVPIKASAYLNKVQCFCFERQKLAAGEKMIFPVSFFIDPEIMNDPQMDDVKTLVLSYTFFEYK